MEMKKNNPTNCSISAEMPRPRGTSHKHPAHILRHAKQIRLLAIFCALASAASPVQAGMYKCLSSEGITYSETPCPSGGTSTPIQRMTSIGKGGSRFLSNVDAVPLPAPQYQRKAYVQFLETTKPRAFIICNDKSVSVLKGPEDFLQKQIATMRASGCAPYAINDKVVWEGE